MPPSGSVSASFTLDDNLVALGLAAVFGALGVIVLVNGWLSLRATTVGPRLLAYARTRTAGAAGLDDDALRDALVTRRHVQAWGEVFAGTGIAMLVAVALGGSWLARGDFLLVSALHGWAMILAILLGLMLGLAIGYAYGVHRLRARSAGQPVYGDLRQRRLSDFVPRWYAPVYGAGVVLLWAQALVVLPFLKSHPTTVLLGGAVAPLPLGCWALLASPLAALLVTVLGVALVRWIVALPTLRYCADMRQSAAVEAGFRRETVRALLLQGAQLLFLLAVFQWVLMLDNLTRASYDSASLLLAPFLAVIGIVYLVMTLKLSMPRLARPAGPRGGASAP